MDFLASQNWRTEDKFLVAARSVHRVLADLRSLGTPDAHAGADGSYEVTSLYFDTRAHVCYTDYVRGIARRFKCRLRSYDGFESMHLELKLKDNRFSRKLALPVPAGLDRSNLELPHVPALEPLQLFRLRERALQATAYTRYRRFAVTTDGFRVTLDTEMSFAAPSATPLFRTSSAAVLEVKGHGAYPLRLRDFLRRQQLERTSFSKYAHAIEGLGLA